VRVNAGGGAGSQITGDLFGVGVTRGGGGGSQITGVLNRVGVMDGGGAGSQMIGLEGGNGLVAGGGVGIGSQIIGQQRVVAAPLDMTNNARMVFCVSLESLCQGIIVTSVQIVILSEAKNLARCLSDPSLRSG